ncbi:gag-pol polyprotein [Lasius niger]|uniref:Gag-pol polyprotein n=2 Tax=Lasius TaxID=488720 RepID=A0A0J7NKX0_LASNI|nr:gag-pol polyprotein [Lasius niger]
MPVELHTGIEKPFKIDPRLKPLREDENKEEREEEVEIVERRIETARETLKARAQQRKRQTDKHGETEAYRPGDKVWEKLHRRSDANCRLTRKIHLVYNGPYKIREEVRRNAYLIEDEEGNMLGTFNSRQIKPHREVKLKPVAQINMIKTEREVKKITRGEMKTFAENMQRKMEEDEEKKNREILTEEIETRKSDPGAQFCTRLPTVVVVVNSVERHVSIKGILYDA